MPPGTLSVPTVPLAMEHATVRHLHISCAIFSGALFMPGAWLQGQGVVWHSVFPLQM